MNTKHVPETCDPWFIFSIRKPFCLWIVKSLSIWCPPWGIQTLTNVWFVCVGKVFNEIIMKESIIGNRYVTELYNYRRFIKLYYNIYIKIIIWRKNTIECGPWFTNDINTHKQQTETKQIIKTFAHNLDDQQQTIIYYIILYMYIVYQ